MVESAGPASAAWSARRVRLSGTSILFAVFAVVAVYVARDLFVAATQPLGWVAAAVATALVIAPLVAVLARWLPRAVAVAVTVLVILAIVGSVGAGLFVQVQDQLAQLSDDLPAAAAELERSGGDDGLLAELRFTSLVQDLVDQTSDRVSPQATIEDAAGTAPAYFVTGILVLFLLAWADRMFQGFLRQISDEQRRERLATGLMTAAHLTQRYVVGAIGHAVLIGIAGGVLAWAIGLPTPLVLGVILAVASLVPYLGVLFGSLPILVLAGALEPTLTTIAVGVALIGLQAASTVAHRRVIEARSFRVGPAVIVVAVLIGSDVYGIGGAFVAMIAGVYAVAAIEASRLLHDADQMLADPVNQGARGPADQASSLAQ